MDTWKKIQLREADLTDLYTRIKNDRKIALLEKYTLTGVSGSIYANKEVPGTISVTMNKPGVFLNAIVYILQSARRQWRVEGMSDVKNHNLELYFENMFYEADRSMPKRIPSLWAFWCAHVAHTGPIGARIIRQNGVPKIRPVDMLYTPFDFYAGEPWVAHHFTRPASQIEAEYPGAIQMAGLRGDETAVEGYDHWTKKVNEIWINARKIEEYPNPWGEIPFVIEFPPTGLMTEDIGFEAQDGESIFALDRNLYSEWNRLQSIKHTIAYGLIKPPYATEKNPGSNTETEYPKIGTNTPVEKGEMPHLVETKDINVAFRGDEVTISQALQQGSLSDADLGDVSLDRTAVWLAAQGEIRNKTLNPRWSCLNSGSIHAAELMLLQHKLDRNSQPVGKPGMRKVYSGADLPDKGDFVVEYKFLSKNKQMEIANLAEAKAAEGLMPLKYILENIAEVEDPKGVYDSLQSEKAESSSPVLFFYRQAHRLVDIANSLTGDEAKQKRMEARIMTQRMVSAMWQESGGQIQTPEQRQGSGMDLIATMPKLMGGGGGGGQRQEAANAR